MQPLNGSDLQAAYQVAQPRAALWSEFSVPVKIAYEQTAQALNVKLGLTEELIEIALQQDVPPAPPPS